MERAQAKKKKKNMKMLVKIQNIQGVGNKFDMGLMINSYLSEPLVNWELEPLVQTKTEMTLSFDMVWMLVTFGVTLQELYLI